MTGCWDRLSAWSITVTVAYVVTIEAHNRLLLMHLRYVLLYHDICFPFGNKNCAIFTHTYLHI